MNPYLEKALWTLTGGLVVKYFDKFKKRIRYAEYSISIGKIGLDQRHMALGNIEISFNGNAVLSLYVCELTIQNTSGIDLENAIITIDVFEEVVNHRLSQQGDF